MSGVKLQAGDAVQFRSEAGLKLRGVVSDDALMLKARGEELLVPIKRIRAGAVHHCAADGKRVTGPKVRWLPRSEVRKLPVRANRP